MIFWLRWSLRDLKQRWLQVCAIALIIALGTGAFSGLGSQQEWREASYDRSYAQLNMFDLRLSLTEGSYVDGSELLTVLTGIDGVAGVETRLITPTLVDASTGTETILVSGQIIGVDVSDGGPHVNSINIELGRALTETDRGGAVAILDYLFARYYDLEPGSPIRISGDLSLDFVGAGQSPEYFQIVPPDGGSILGESSFAVLYMPLESLQRITQREGMVNDAVILLDGDRAELRGKIEEEMATSFPAVGFDLTDKEEDPVYELMYGDAEGDQEFWDMIALLFLAGAALAAFNLAGRIVEAQRRQIGIGMALGMPRHWLAIRPTLVGFQIAALGTVLGLIFGYVLSNLFAGFYRDLVPLPGWEDPFYPGSYVQATLLGIIIPFVATLYPVWRAVRVRPLEAIKTGYLVAKGGGLAPFVRDLPLPGKSFTQIPIRNLLRSPRRTLLTLLGIAIAIALFTLMAGVLDSFFATLDRAEAAFLGQSPDRMTIVLDDFYPTQDTPASPISELKSLTGTGGTPLFDEVVASLILPGNLVGDESEIPVALEIINVDNPIWTPTLLAGNLPGTSDEIVISEKASRDLDASVGDYVRLSHPQRHSLFAFRMVEDQFKVVGIHNNPLRPLSYLAPESAEMMQVGGLANYLTVNPATGISQDEVRRVLFSQQGVASVEAVADVSDQFEDGLALLVSVLRLIQGVVLVMAFLIAFNSTSINVDDRIREIATLFAFGLPVRTVTRMQVLENLLIGLLGTGIGIGLGYYGVRLMMVNQVGELIPDIQFAVSLTSSTVLVASILGVLVVSLTPLFSIRKIMRLDIPSTLRVME